MAVSDGPRKVVFQKECIVRVLELLSTQVLFMPAQGQGSQSIQWGCWVEPDVCSAWL